jgi:hypothetical protein
MFVPTADFFAQLRTSAAAQDLQHQFLDNEDDDNGLERFITATRRQNFLVPPRRHRSFRCWNCPEQVPQVAPGRGRYRPLGQVIVSGATRGVPTSSWIWACLVSGMSRGLPSYRWPL